MKYLIIYLEVKHLLNFLSQIEKGDLLDILIKYAEDEIDPKIENKNVLNVFNFLRSRLDEQFAKVKLKAEVARVNGANGGRPTDKKPKKTKNNPTTTQDNPQEPNGLLVNIEGQFESFWQSYKPIHTGKGNKEKSKQLFLKALKEDSLENINKGLADYMNHCHTKNSYTKSVEVWLRNEGWKDEYSGKAGNQNTDICTEINKIIGQDLITKIETSGKAAQLYTTSAYWKKITSLSEEAKEKIKKELALKLGTATIEPKY